MLPQAVSLVVVDGREDFHIWIIDLQKSAARLLLCKSLPFNRYGFTGYAYCSL